MTNRDQITLPGFFTFAEKQSGSYSYMNNGTCALAQYLKSLGFEKPHVGGAEVMLSGYDEIKFNQFFKFNQERPPGNWSSTEAVITFKDLFNIDSRDAAELSTVLQLENWNKLADKLLVLAT